VPPDAQKVPSNPLIPEKYLDIPSQRLYYLSLGLLFQVLYCLYCSQLIPDICARFQAIKFFDFVRSLISSESRTIVCRKWLFVDFAYCVILSQLRIPRLKYRGSAVLLQVLLLWLFDAVIFGGISVNFAALLGWTVVPTGPEGTLERLFVFITKLNTVH
jgi:nucleoporin POM152